VNALLFGVYGFFMDIQMKNPGDDPTLMQIYLAGTGSGIVNRYTINTSSSLFFNESQDGSYLFQFFIYIYSVTNKRPSLWPVSLRRTIKQFY
jgi:hypothetical protein